jgi:glycosyltransferase involved in cell wall biosynthesis
MSPVIETMGTDRMPKENDLSPFSPLLPVKKDDNIEITIGMTVKNRERTVGKAVESILQQTFPSEQMEIIVVDGNSTDRTVEILKAVFSKSSVQLRLFFDNGKGLGIARNMIVDNARGRFIIWLDDDMFFPKEYVQRQFDLMNCNPSIGVASGRQKLKLNGSSVSQLESLSNLRDLEIVKKKNVKRANMSIIRVDAIRKVGGFDKSIVGAGEDADITGRIRDAGYILAAGEAEFEHEERQTWQGLWKQNFWYGYGMHYLNHKNKSLVNFRLRFPPISFVEGTIRSIMGFTILHQRIALLLPFFNIFKAAAWWVGFYQSSRKGYGHTD